MASIGRVLLIPKGDYSSSVTYNNLDWVRYGGKAWVCKVDGTTNVTPVQGANWQLLAQDGSGGGGGASDWDDINYKPFDTIDTTTDFSVDNLDNNKLHIKRDTFGVMRIVSGGSTTDLEASGDSVFEIDAGTNVTISADDSSNPKKITINSSGGGGGGLSNAFDEVSVGGTTIAASGGDTLTLSAGSNITLTPNAGSKSVEISASGGGHTMIDTVADIDALTDGDDDYVVNGYAIKQWSNTDDIQLLVAVSADDDGIGTWEDDDTWETSGVRTGWIQHASLHGIMSDDDVMVEPVFKVPSGNNNAVSAYAMRVDDAITGSLGGVAIKFNAPITANGYAGVRIRHLRTNTIILTP